MALVLDILKKFGCVFYILNPNEHLYDKTSDVPDYYKEVTPVFISMIVLEQVALFLSGKPLARLNDSLANICQGMLVEIFKIPLQGVELLLYTWIYTHYRVAELPWNSAWTWLICMVTTDFCFYWMHRATHQISILWTFHEPHHSSEEFNLMVPLRLSVFTSSALWLTYFPMALAVPPSIFFVHYQLNIIYQYWLHCLLVPKLGFIEWIFVTPTHHKVHHGRNRRCIDKNFGGFLIIWDRIFGTFEPNRGEEVKFGVVHPLRTFSPYTIQTNNLQNIWRRLKETEGFVNKVSVFIKGPGWSPGKPWLGNIEDVPEPSENEEKYDPPLPMWMKIYLIFHAAVVISGYLLLILNLEATAQLILPFNNHALLKESTRSSTSNQLVAPVFRILSTSTTVWCSLFILFSTMAFGVLLDGSQHSAAVELCRCIFYFVVDAVVGDVVSPIHPLSHFFLHVSRYLFFGTFLFWLGAVPHTKVMMKRKKE